MDEYRALVTHSKTFEYHIVRDQVFITHEQNGTQLQPSASDAYELLSYLYDHRDQLYTAAQKEMQHGS